MMRVGAWIVVAGLLVGGCSGGGDEGAAPTTTAAGASAGPTTTQSGSGAGTSTTASGSAGGPLPAACSLLTDERAGKVLAPGNEDVFRVDRPETDQCLYNSLVRRGDSLNGGNLELSLAEAALPAPPEGATPLELGDEAFVATQGETLTVHVRLGSTLMTLFVQPSPNNTRITLSSARDPLVAVAREIVAALCPPRCR